MSENTAATAFVSPGQHQFYTCGDVQDRVTALRLRQAELEQLMGRASQSAGGEFVNSIAYRSDYLETRGEITVLRQVFADKQCAAESKFSSGRAVF
jgi:hypothetical protein